jgi:hypothetical protein
LKGYYDAGREKFERGEQGEWQGMEGIVSGKGKKTER